MLPFKLPSIEIEGRGTTHCLNPIQEEYIQMKIRVPHLCKSETRTAEDYRRQGVDKDGDGGADSRAVALEAQGADKPAAARPPTAT